MLRFNGIYLIKTVRERNNRKISKRSLTLICSCGAVVPPFLHKVSPCYRVYSNGSIIIIPLQLPFIHGISVYLQILVGSSIGGWLMLLAAIARPEKTAALVGISSAADHIVTSFNSLPLEVGGLQTHPECVRDFWLFKSIP